MKKLRNFVYSQKDGQFRLRSDYKTRGTVRIVTYSLTLEDSQRLDRLLEKYVRVPIRSESGRFRLLLKALDSLE